MMCYDPTCFCDSEYNMFRCEAFKTRDGSMVAVRQDTDSPVIKTNKREQMNCEIAVNIYRAAYSQERVVEMPYFKYNGIAQLDCLRTFDDKELTEFDPSKNDFIHGKMAAHITMPTTKYFKLILQDGTTIEGELTALLPVYVNSLK